MKFKKRPIIIEAIQFKGNQKSFIAIYNMAGCENVSIEKDLQHLRMETLEGVMFAKVNDWIVKGIKDEIYPVKNNIFKLTYTPV